MATTDFIESGSLSPSHLYSRLQVQFVAGVTIGGSIAVTGLSNGRGDKLAFVSAIKRASANGTSANLGTPLNLSQASVSIVGGNRVKIATTNTTGSNLFVMWFRGDVKG